MAAGHADPPLIRDARILSSQSKSAIADFDRFNHSAGAVVVRPVFLSKLTNCRATANSAMTIF